MPHSIEEIQSLLVDYDLLARQKTYLQKALDYPGDQITIMPDPDAVVTFIPIFNTAWLRGHLDLLGAGIRTRRQAIRDELEAAP